MEHAEGLRELVRSLVRQTVTDGEGIGGELAIARTASLTTDQKILDELVRIRLLFEMPRKKTIKYTLLRSSWTL